MLSAFPNEKQNFTFNELGHEQILPTQHNFVLTF